MTHWILFAAPLVVASLVMLLVFVGCSFSAPASHYEDIIIGTSGIVSYWRLGEDPGATVAADEMGHNPGAYLGGVTLGVPGLVHDERSNPDTAAQFDGSTGYVKVDHGDGSVNPPMFTIMALARVTGGAGQFRAVVSSRHLPQPVQTTFGYILYANQDNRWEAWVGDGATTQWHIVTGPPVVEEATQFLALTHDGTTLTLYVDPVEDNSETRFSAPAPYAPNPQQELRIAAGANETSPLYFFDGVIDEVAIYDHAFDFAQIRVYFANALASLAP
jgi:hypothetical protein